jgi:D-alanyl-D-alanine carboxypeptidase
MKNEFFKQVVGTKSYKCIVTTVDGKKRINEWENTNKLLRREGFVGLKTGITVTAGPCLASAFCFKGKTYISVILRAKKVSRRFK